MRSLSLCALKRKAKARYASIVFENDKYQHSGFHTYVNLMFLQQMTRSQQMDELLDVLIESGGEHTDRESV